MIPERTLDSLKRYATSGVPTGGFLRSILEDRGVFIVVGRADEENYAALKEILKYIYNEIPAACWGSPEEVDAWIKTHRKSREEKGLNVETT